MNDFLLRWRNLGYSKHSGTEHHLEFGIIEALLWEKIDIRYIGTSGCDYLSLPDEEDSAELIITAAQKAREIRKSFIFQKRKTSEGFRTYIARSADEFELYANKMLLIPDPLNPKQQNGFIASDRFVMISMHNRTYEEG